ncbi:uncharacterized protein LOC135379212 [Ornithodoros turicata]|uniref:uncharacterized protein LOC135379212 n=1 Tax=Ornithodoros turicata TaxID=34597 RepID=UPI0031399406
MKHAGNSLQVLYLLLETSKDGQLSTLLEALVTHGMSLYQLSVGDTKQKVYAACKEVLQEKAVLENMQTSISSREQAVQYKKSASILERFEATINIAVVELIVDNYMGLILALERLLEAAELYARQQKSGSAGDGTVDLSIGFKGSVVDFCAAVDQVYNIVQQAVGCSTDEQRVTSLLSEQAALEQLDPELVAGAVALATDTNDRGLKTTLSQLQVAWEFHTKNLFRNLLHLCNPDTFFDALDISLKCGIAQLERSDARCSALKKMVAVASSAIDISRVVFEDVGIPESLQVAVDHLAVAIRALKNAPEERYLKRAKVVRGCACRLREELREHLPLSSVEFTGEADSTKLSCQEQDVESSKDTCPVLDVTKILNQMRVSVQDSTIGPVSDNVTSVTFQRKDVSKIFPSFSCRDLPQVSQRLETSVLRNKGLASILQMTEQQRLKHTIRLSKEAIGHTEMGQWIQNNSSVCTLAVKMKHLASQLRSDKVVSF